MNLNLEVLFGRLASHGADLRIMHNAIITNRKSIALTYLRFIVVLLNRKCRVSAFSLQ